LHSEHRLILPSAEVVFYAQCWKEKYPQRQERFGRLAG